MTRQGLRLFPPPWLLPGSYFYYCFSEGMLKINLYQLILFLCLQYVWRSWLLGKIRLYFVSCGSFFQQAVWWSARTDSETLTTVSLVLLPAMKSSNCLARPELCLQAVSAKPLLCAHTQSQTHLKRWHSWSYRGFDANPISKLAELPDGRQQKVTLLANNNIPKVVFVALSLHLIVLKLNNENKTPQDIVVLV